MGHHMSQGLLIVLLAGVLSYPLFLTAAVSEGEKDAIFSSAFLTGIVMLGTVLLVLCS
jgi:ABC-type microcin C transport system permease subunit YejB